MMRKSLAMVFDTLFILLLCFATLLATMLVTSKMHGAVSASGYVVNRTMLVSVIIIVCSFLLGIVCISEAEFANIIENEFLNKGGAKAK